MIATNGSWWNSQPDGEENSFKSKAGLDLGAYIITVTCSSEYRFSATNCFFLSLGVWWLKSRTKCHSEGYISPQRLTLHPPKQHNFFGESFLKNAIDRWASKAQDQRLVFVNLFHNVFHPSLSRALTSLKGFCSLSLTHIKDLLPCIRDGRGMKAAVNTTLTRRLSTLLSISRRTITTKRNLRR